MVAPHGPLSATSAAALSKLNLETTPAGIAAFTTKFPSALEPLLASTQNRNEGTLNKHDTRATKLLELIYDCLIGYMPDDNDIVTITAMRARRAHHLKNGSSATASSADILCSKVPESADSFSEHLGHLNSLGLSP